MLFGKPATADKWISEAADNAFYKTRAESDGFIFLPTIRVSAGSSTGSGRFDELNPPQVNIAKRCEAILGAENFIQLFGVPPAEVGATLDKETFLAQT